MKLLARRGCAYTALGELTKALYDYQRASKTGGSVVKVIGAKEKAEEEKEEETEEEKEEEPRDEDSDEEEERPGSHALRHPLAAGLASDCERLSSLLAQRTAGRHHAYKRRVGAPLLNDAAGVPAVVVLLVPLETASPEKIFAVVEVPEQKRRCLPPRTSSRRSLGGCQPNSDSPYLGTT